MSKEGIWKEIKEERGRQDAQWGGPDHDDTHALWNWIIYIRGHNKAAGKLMLQERPVHDFAPAAVEQFRKQMVRVAALAVAAIESVDRRRLKERK